MNVTSLARRVLAALGELPDLPTGTTVPCRWADVDDLTTGKFVIVAGDVVRWDDLDLEHGDVALELLGAKGWDAVDPDMSFAAGFTVGDDAVLLATEGTISAVDAAAALRRAGIDRVYEITGPTVDAELTRIARCRLTRRAEDRPLAPDDLAGLADDLGDEVQLRSRMDVIRDAALVYLDGEVHVGDESAVHRDVLADLVDTDETRTLDDVRYGVADSSATEHAFAAGHVFADGDVVLIETTTITNCTADDVLAAVQEEFGSGVKVYLIDALVRPRARRVARHEV